MAGHIIVTDEGATRIIVMRRPEKKNALTPEMFLAMSEAINSMVADQSRFTDIDRDTWIRWKAVGFRGVDIDWTGICSPRDGGTPREPWRSGRCCVLRLC